MKWLVVLLLYDGRQRKRSTVERDCSFPVHVSYPHYENREFAAAEANGQEMGSE